MELKPPAALYDKGGNNYEFLWEAKESQRSPSKLLPDELLISKLRRCRTALQRRGKQNEQDARADNNSAINWHLIWKDWKLVSATVSAKKRMNSQDRAWKWFYVPS